MPQPTAVIITLGCRLNQADSAQIAEQLREHGFRLGEARDQADLIVINSCTVTGEAGRKTRQAARSARRRCPAALIAVVGCDPQVDRQFWDREPAADLVLGNREKHRLIEHLPSALGGSIGERDTSESDAALWPRGRAAGSPPADGRSGEAAVGHYPHRTRANLKVQEGCDFFCSYCIVPHARGEPRSHPLEAVLEEAHGLLGRGHRELVLTGVNLGLYRDRDCDLADLLTELSKIDRDFRLRLSSVEPGPIIPRLLEAIKRQPKICRFLHMPLQYGANRILRAMNRRYTVEEYGELARQAVATIPGLCLGTDIIVGFPGEDEAAFEQCLATVDELAFGNLHIFRYSPRPGTPAAGLSGAVAGGLAEERYRCLRRLASRKEGEFARGQIGEELHVLIEAPTPRKSGNGWSDNYLRVCLGTLPKGLQGQFARARIRAVGRGRQVEGTIET